jgi:hypothetical protein
MLVEPVQLTVIVTVEELYEIHDPLEPVASPNRAFATKNLNWAAFKPCDVHIHYY